MPTLGEELRHKREQKGVTLAEIAEATRIGTRFLKAIETDNFSILPGGIFTRSFIRAYAKHVGMNEDEAIALYLHQVAERSVEQQELQAVPAITQVAPAEKVKKQQSPPLVVAKQPVRAAEPSRRFEPVALRQSPARTNWATIVIGAGIVIFIVLIVLALVKQLNQGKGESASPASSVAQNNAPPKSTQQPTSPAQSGSGPSQPEQPPPSLSQGQPLVVKLEAATGDSWVKYQVDDSKPITLILKQGESRDLPPAQSQVTVNYGNRTTLKFKINDREATFPPDSPKFKSKVVISRDNLKSFFQ
jgi:cytoskeleton protein RodZ